jgi:DNA invertase Pin-like site-specific DNA recombinase
MNTDTPQGEFMLTILAAVAQLERATIRERQLEGIAVAKAKGVYKGRKAALTADQAAELRDRHAAGERPADLARSYGVSRQTVYRYLATPPDQE